MIRCVRLWTGPDGNSRFELGRIDLEPGERGDGASVAGLATAISFRETAAGGAFAWHDAPQRQLVLTLAGVLQFETREGARFGISPGDVLLAEDTTGGGHRWHLVGAEPWRRAYVLLVPGATVPFVAG